MARPVGRNRMAKAGLVLACASLVVVAAAPGIAGLAGYRAELVLHALVAVPLVALACSVLGFVRRTRCGGDGRLGAALGVAYVDLSGATEVLDDAGFFDEARGPGWVDGLRWLSHERHSAAELDEAARRLSAAKQLWIMGRTMPGFLAIAVDLDGDGRVSRVSRIVGRSSS